MANDMGCCAEGQRDVLQTSTATMAAVMRCLAHAPQLPPLDWGTPCQRLLNLAASTQAAEHPDSTSGQDTEDSADMTADSTCGLGTACLLLTLKHGGVASLGLGGLLDQLMNQPWFSQLPAQLQQMLLTSLPEVLQALSSQRSAAVFSALSTLSLSSKRQHAGPLSAAAWTGLARLMHSVQDSNSNSAAPAGAVVEEAHRAVVQMLQQLPLPPFLLPGEALPGPSMQLDDVLHSTIAAEGMHSSLQQHAATQREEERTEAEVWGAACACLQKMPTQQVRTGCCTTSCLDCGRPAATVMPMLIVKLSLNKIRILELFWHGAVCLRPRGARWGMLCMSLPDMVLIKQFAMRILQQSRAAVVVGQARNTLGA